MAGSSIRRSSSARANTACARRKRNARPRCRVGSAAAALRRRRRYRLAVGEAPRLAEFLARLGGLGGFSLSRETFGKSVDRARIAGVDSQVRAIDGLRLSWPAHRQKLRAKRFAHRVIPDWRLFIDKRVLH